MLREWRHQNGVTLEEVADVSGYSESMISRIERGERSLGALDKIRLARTLGVRVRDIFPPDGTEAK